MSYTRHRSRTLRSGLPGLLAGVLLAGGVALLPAPAQAAEHTFAWEISPRFDDHLSTHTLSDGATEDADGVITFAGGVASEQDGVTSVAYQGEVTGAFVAAVVEYYWVTLADPIVSVDGEGNGEVSAVVSAWNAGGMGNQEESSDPTRVTVTTFDAPAAYDESALTATPHWTGVLPPGSPEATAMGIPDGQPVDGAAFHPDFLAHVTSGVRAHFYASGAASDSTKAPSSFTAGGLPAAAATPTVDVATTETSYADGLGLEVAGTGFTAVTNPGDAGVYVGLAPSGGLPDVDSQEDMDEFAAVAWVMPQQMPEGDFTVTLDAPADALERGTDYSVYTWQAHTHSNTTQDTETPVAIDWDALRAPVSVAGEVLKKPTPDKRGRLEVTVAGAAGSGTPAGKVEVDLVRKGEVVETRSKKLDGGVAVVKLPPLKKGKWQLKVRYLGSDDHLAGKKTVRITVPKG